MKIYIWNNTWYIAILKSIMFSGLAASAMLAHGSFYDQFPYYL